MRRALGVVLTCFSFFVACGLSIEGVDNGAGVDGGGASGGSSGSGGSSSCFPGPGQKCCDGQAVSAMDPAYGCNSSSCAKCEFPNATAICGAEGKCQVDPTSCAAGFMECDMLPANGCETNSLSDPKNCGSCGNDCSVGDPTVQWLCKSGLCEPSNCPVGQAECDNTGQACETSLLNDPNNCGFCGNVCSLPNVATHACLNGTCTTSSCNNGWADCQNPLDGCEVNIEKDYLNCGACGTVCDPFHTTARECQGGQCRPSCENGWADCFSNSNDGCETNIAVDPTHCGSCSKACSTVGGTPNCSGGQCAISCAPGRASCDMNPDTGCESNLTTPQTCGSCNKQCTNAHGTTQCNGGNCAPTCSNGFRDCSNPDDGCETNVSVSAQNCGDCNIQCINPHGTTQCSSGNCNPSCASGWGDCDNNSQNGCETDVSSASRCGSCNKQCTNPHGTTLCNGGNCVPSCSSGWADCDGNPDNGCEADITSVTRCGSCNTACTNPHGSTACNGGSCSPTCSPSAYGDCDGNPNNGCETNTNVDEDNCGTCGKTCNTNQTCQTGSCTGSGGTGGSGTGGTGG